MIARSRDIVGISNVNQPTADEIEQAVEEARKLEGLADFVWIRAGSEHPNSFVQDKDRPWNLAYAEAIKKAGLRSSHAPAPDSMIRYRMTSLSRTARQIWSA